MEHSRISSTASPTVALSLLLEPEASPGAHSPPRGWVPRRSVSSPEVEGASQSPGLNPGSIIGCVLLTFYASAPFASGGVGRVEVTPRGVAAESELRAGGCAS